MKNDRLITIEEFLEIPDPIPEARLELIRGRVVSFPLGTGRHGYLCSQVGGILYEFVTNNNNLGWVVGNNSGVILERYPDTLCSTDLGFWSYANQPAIPKEYFETAPDIAVEILETHDTKDRIRELLNIYLNAGAKLFWVIDPDSYSVMVYNRKYDVVRYAQDDMINGDDVLPGFACKASDMI